MAKSSNKPTPKTKASFSRAGIGFGVLVQSACVLFLVMAANYVGFNYFQRWDFSRSQRFTLADQTRQALRQFQPPLKMTVYFSPTNLGLDSALYGDVQNLLAELKFAARDKLSIEWVDPVRDVSRGNELQEKYKFDGTQNLVVLDYGGRVKLVPILDLGDYDMSGVAVGEPARLQAFIGEAVLTAAFVELLSPDRARVYFVQGHGETPSTDLQRLQDAIARQNAESWGLNLASANAIPQEADAVCIVGARYDFSPREIDVLRDYWRKNGRLIVLIDPESMAGTPNLRKFINSACVYPRPDRVLCVIQNPLNPGVIGVNKDIVNGLFLPNSVITKRLAGVNARFVGGTLSLLLDVAGAARADIQLRPLVQAAEGYWGETHFLYVRDGVRYDEGEDAGQPVIVAAYAEKGGAQDDRTDVASSRLVVVGNAGFIADRSLDAASQGNLDFMINVINRMLERKALLGVAPRTVTNYMLNLTDPQLRGIALYALFIIPGAVALLGLVVGFRRRA